MAGWYILKNCKVILKDATAEQVYEYFGISNHNIPMIKVEDKYRGKGYRFQLRL